MDDFEPFLIILMLLFIAIMLLCIIINNQPKKEECKLHTWKMVDNQLICIKCAFNPVFETKIDLDNED